MKEVRKGETVFLGKRINDKCFNSLLWPFLRQRMLSFQDKIALVNPYTREELSYSRVVSLVDNLSRSLYKLGLRQGRSVCIFTPNSVENVLLVLSTVAVGGFVHGSNPASLAGELRRQLSVTDAMIVATTPQLLPVVKEAVGTKVKIIIIGPRDNNINYDDLLTLGSEDVVVAPTVGDPSNIIATLIFSSGTTGMPKGVELTQRNIMAMIHVIQHFDKTLIEDDDTILLFLPLFHGFGLTVILFPSLVYGSKIVVMGKYNVNQYLTFVEQFQATVLPMVPPVIVEIANHAAVSSYNLTSVKRVFSAAAPLGVEAEAKFLQKIPLPCILQGYGMTENIIMNWNTYDHHRPGSCGRLLPGVECKIVEPETGRSLGENEIGELCMRGPTLMRGYYRNPQATRDTIDPQGWLHSGDIAKVDSDGFFYIVDRRKELIKFKGEQVPPAMLEDVLLGHPAVTDACVIGRPDTMAGELPMAYVVKATGSDLTEQEVKDFVAKNVPSYMQLRGGVEFRQQIPKSPSGKILRRLLRDELKQQLQAKL